MARQLGLPYDARSWLGDAAYEIVRHADRVEVFRIDHAFREDAPPAPGSKSHVGGFQIARRAAPAAPAFLGELVAVLLDDRTFDFEYSKNCGFAPGVGYRVWRGSDSVDVLVCFTCDAVRVVTGEGEGARRVTVEADSGRAALLKLARAALPKDRGLAELPEERPDRAR